MDEVGVEVEMTSARDGEGRINRGKESDRDSVTPGVILATLWC